MVSHEGLHAAKQRTLAWALGLLNEDGFTGAHDPSLALYKAPVVFLSASEGAAAACAMNAAKALGLRNGDFQAAIPELRSRSYRNAWLAWGAHGLGLYDISGPTLDRLEQHLHPKLHGVPDDDTLHPQQQYFTAGATAQAIHVLMACGRFDTALRAAKFLQALVAEQADVQDEVVLARHHDGRLVDPRTVAAADGAGAMAFHLRQRDPVCWVVGLMLRVFARLFRVSGDTAWLQCADTAHQWLMRADDSKYSNITSAKLAWGAAEMAGVTGQVHWRAMAERIGQWLLDQQDSSGIWVRRPQYRSAAEQPVAVSLDTSLERLLYLLDIPRALGLSQCHPSFQGEAS